MFAFLILCGWFLWLLIPVIVAVIVAIIATIVILIQGAIEIHREGKW